MMAHSATRLAKMGGCRPVNEIVGTAPLNILFLHPTNGVVGYTATVPSSSSIGLAVRLQDATNYWNVYVTSAGAFGLSEVVAGSGTNRANVNGAVATGNRVVVVMDGTSITGYVNGVQSWTYASASNFATRFIGTPFLIGTGGALDDLRSWPLSCRRMEGV